MKLASLLQILSPVIKHWLEPDCSDSRNSMLLSQATCFALELAVSERSKQGSNSCFRTIAIERTNLFIYIVVSSNLKSCIVAKYFQFINKLTNTKHYFRIKYL